MQRTFYTHSKFETTGFSHFKRYSEQDFKTAQIDKLLITQTNNFSHPKIRSLKTKLPQISQTTSLPPFNSQNGKIEKAGISIKELEMNIQSINAELKDMRIQAAVSSSSLMERADKVSGSLRSKVERLAAMVAYTIGQGEARTERIQKQCAFLQQNNAVLKKGVEGVRQRMQRIEQMMGVYTGEDKHLV